VESEIVISSGIELNPLLVQITFVLSNQRERDQIPRGLLKRRRDESEGRKRRVSRVDEMKL